MKRIVCKVFGHKPTVGHYPESFIRLATKFTNALRMGLYGLPPIKEKPTCFIFCKRCKEIL